MIDEKALRSYLAKRDFGGCGGAGITHADLEAAFPADEPQPATGASVDELNDLLLSGGPLAVYERGRADARVQVDKRKLLVAIGWVDAGERSVAIHALLREAGVEVVE